MVAISYKRYGAVKKLPRNVNSLVGRAQDILPELYGRRSAAGVVTDYYGAFTFSPGEQVDLLQLYHNVLITGGRAFIRFDADHIGVVNEAGALMLFSDWLNGLKMPEIKVIDGPNPTGPTAQVKVVDITRTSGRMDLPKLKLIGTRKVKGDAVPFVVYKEIK